MKRKLINFKKSYKIGHLPAYMAAVQKLIIENFKLVVSCDTTIKREAFQHTLNKLNKFYTIKHKHLSKYMLDLLSIRTKSDFMINNSEAFYVEPFPNIRSLTNLLNKLNDKAELTFSIFQTNEGKRLIEITVGEKGKTITESLIIIFFIISALKAEEIDRLAEIIGQKYISGHNHPFVKNIEEKFKGLFKQFGKDLSQETIKNVIKESEPYLSEGDLMCSFNGMVSKHFMIQYRPAKSLSRKKDQIRLSIFKNGQIIKQATYLCSDKEIVEELRGLGLIK